MIRNSKVAVRYLLALLLVSVCYLNFWSYSRQEQLNPELFSDVARGTASAPQQYRVLVVRTAWFLHHHSRLQMRHAFALLDTLSAFGCCFLLLYLMEQTDVFRRSEPVARSLAHASFLFLCGYYLIWLTWYQRPETLPTALGLSAMLWLSSVIPKNAAVQLAVATATLAVATVQALIRADVAVAFYSAVAVTSMLPFGARMPQRRSFLLPTSLAAILLAAGTQWVLMHVVYPRATYGDTAVFQLRYNLSPQSLLTVFVFAAPVFWTAWSAWNSRDSAPVPFLTLMLAAGLFLPLWAIVGRIQEVRIFLPFAIALAPLTVCQWIAGGVDAGDATRTRVHR